MVCVTSHLAVLKRGLVPRRPGVGGAEQAEWACILSGREFVSKNAVGVCKK